MTAPTAARARFLSTAYRDLTEDIGRLHSQIDRLRPFHAAGTIAAWQELANEGDWVALAEALISAHYDPRYGKSIARSDKAVRTIALEDLEDVTLLRTAQDLAQTVR